MKSSNTSPTSLSELPDDQRQQVLSYLTHSELLTLTLVSKAVKNIALRSHTLTTTNDDDSIPNTNVDLRRTIVNPANMDPFSSHPRQRRWTVTSANLLSSSSSPSSPSMSMSMSMSMNHHNLMTERNLINILQRFQSIRTLKLYNLAPTTENFIHIINSCPAASALTHIEFHNVRLVQNQYSLQLPCQNHNLKHLILSGTIFCTYQHVLKSFVSSKNLQSLCLDGCRSITDSDVGDMTNISFNMPMSKLVKLSLKNSSKLINPTIKSSSLIKLNLSQCPILRDLSHVVCPNLIELDLVHCSMVNDESIQSILFSCPLIETLLLNGCNSLTALNITSKRMKKVELNLCIALMSANIQCDKLEKLELAFCGKLKNLRLDLKQLKSLDLSMLGIKDFFLHAPTLLDLNLSGCVDLTNESTYLICPNLRMIDISGSNLGSTFEKEHLPTTTTAGKKIHVLRGGAAHDWMTNF